mmetsp:Transcript_5737/g.18111  ORF Transcript_5737/g.18111 Transcript_5737/m.18111 type:complete len:433 (-) Transcript_5737:22-1320(-)
MAAHASRAETVSVFGYGSNGEAQLRARCGNPKLKLRAARAPDHARVFCLKARNWFDGGVASLGKAPGVSALGSLAELSPEEKRKLDKFEKPAYREVELDVECRGADGEWTTEKAVAYVAGDGADEWTPPLTVAPSEPYLTAIVAHLRQFWPDECEDPLEIRCARRGEVGKFAFPAKDPRRLPLEALGVELNARRAAPWTMPSALGPFAAALRGAGVDSTAVLAASLASLEGVPTRHDLAKKLPAAAPDVWDEGAFQALGHYPLHRVFVYGSLLMGLSNNHLLSNATYLGAAVTASELVLTSSGPHHAWPYAIDPARAPARAAGKLQGEMYLCSTATLDNLDSLEGHPDFYERRAVMMEGDPAPVWIYVLNAEPELERVRENPGEFPDAGFDWKSFLDRAPPRPPPPSADEIAAVFEEMEELGRAASGKEEEG